MTRKSKHFWMNVSLVCPLASHSALISQLYSLQLRSRCLAQSSLLHFDWTLLGTCCCCPILLLKEAMELVQVLWRLWQRWLNSNEHCCTSAGLSTSVSGLVSNNGDTPIISKDFFWILPSGWLIFVYWNGSVVYSLYLLMVASALIWLPIDQVCVSVLVCVYLANSKL